MKPADCKSKEDLKNLNEVGLKINDKSITVDPLKVVISLSEAVIAIPQHIFKQFAEWYLLDQNKSEIEELESEKRT